MSRTAAERKEPTELSAVCGKYLAKNSNYSDDSLIVRMRNDLSSGLLPAGSRLKTQELARQYDVSINPVREALHQLSGEGFVTILRNRGAHVRNLDESFLRNIFDIRSLIEPYLIRLFVENATSAEIDELKYIQSYIDQIALDDQTSLETLDEAFHLQTYSGHFNHEALNILERHGRVVQALAMRHKTSPARRKAQNKEHWAIIEAIESHDADRAARVVERHVRGAERHLNHSLRKSFSPS